MVRHPVARLPSTFVGLEKWLEERWKDKVTQHFSLYLHLFIITLSSPYHLMCQETALDQFYSSPSSLSWPVLAPHHQLPRRMTQLQPLCLLFCSGLFLRSGNYKNSLL